MPLHYGALGVYWCLSLPPRDGESHTSPPSHEKATAPGNLGMKGKLKPRSYSTWMLPEPPVKRVTHIQRCLHLFLLSVQLESKAEALQTRGKRTTTELHPSLDTLFWEPGKGCFLMSSPATSTEAWSLLHWLCIPTLDLHCAQDEMKAIASWSLSCGLGFGRDAGKHTRLDFVRLGSSGVARCSLLSFLVPIPSFHSPAREVAPEAKRSTYLGV